MDAIFKALADPTRRALLDALRARDGQTLTELCKSAEMTRFGVMKHLATLEDATLVTTRKKGRFKHHYLNAAPLQEAIDRYIDPYRKPAARGLLDLKTRLEQEATMPDPKPDFVLSTFIACTRDALWDALTDPAQMSRYNFLCDRVEAEDDAYVWYGADGTVHMRCRTLEVEPKSRIVSTFEPQGEGDGKPSRTVCSITEEGDICRLVLEHYDLTFPVIPGEGVHDGWSRWASSLKTYLERGDTPRFSRAAREGVKA